MSTIPGVHVELRIYLCEFFKKKSNWPKCDTQGLEETDSWEKPEVENIVGALSLQEVKIAIERKKLVLTQDFRFLDEVG